MMGDVGKQPRDHCPTCGVPVKVVGGEEGTFYYAPLVVAPDLLSVDPHREKLVDEIMEAQADLQSVIGCQRLYEGRSNSPRASQDIDALERSLARLHGVLGAMGKPMYDPATHPDVDALIPTEGTE